MKRLLLVGLVVMMCPLGRASYVVQRYRASISSFGYTGSMTKYSTLFDAQTLTNALSSHTFAQRDGKMFISKDDYNSGNRVNFGTYWQPTPRPDKEPNSGWGNPNNRTDSFMQILDTRGDTATSSVGGWTSAAYDTFHLNVRGKNATNFDHDARLWNGKASGPVNAIIGTFIEYEIDFTVSGLKGWDRGNGLVGTDINVKPHSPRGYIRGIFRNESVKDPSSNGYYRFDLTINDTSWAFSQPYINGSLGTPEFVGPAVVPEPTSMAAVGLGLVAIARRRRRR